MGFPQIGKKISRTFQGLSKPLHNIFKDQLSTLFKTAIYVADILSQSLTAKEIGVSRNVDWEGPKSDPRNIGEVAVGRGLGRGFPCPGNGVRGEPAQVNFLTTDMLYTSFRTYFVVKFISLVIAFKVLFRKKI